MSLHVIVGAGPVGTNVARLLAERGERVRLISRRGTGPQHPAIEPVAADATQADRLAELTRDAAALYNCVNPLYHRWLTDWPPIAAALLAAAERSGAVLAVASNLYGYGPVDGPITDTTPLAATHPKLRLRADMWREALARHEAGRLRVTEVRSSDYVEANSILSLVLAKPIRAGKRAFVPAALDVPHSWTTIVDAARALVIAATDPRAWGKAWLTPTNPPLTVRALAARFASVVGAPAPKLSPIPYPVLWATGLFVPIVRELRATRYQFVTQFVVDASATEKTFGLAPTVSTPRSRPSRRSDGMRALPRALPLCGFIAFDLYFSGAAPGSALRRGGRPMRMKAIGWVAGSLGLLVGIGSAWGDQGEKSMGQAMDTHSADKPKCQDAGVTVAFKVNSEALDQNARGALDGVATWLKADERRTLYLEGFADTTGSAEPNLVLSAKRADAVKSYLVEQGVAASRVTTIGKGEEIDHLPANGRAVTFLACQQSEPGPATAELQVPEATPPEEPVEALTPVAPAPPPPSPRWKSGYGWAIMAGGGYTDFTQDVMQAETSGGGAWDARFVGGTNSVLGFEAAYVGSARSINTLGVTANNPSLVGNGFEGNLRINAPIRRGNSLFEPYAYAGLGYTYFNISNYNSNTGVVSSFGSSDNTMTFPAGGGFAYAYKSFIADVRAGWTGVYYDDILRTNLSTTTNALNHWNAGGQIGFMF